MCHGTLTACTAAFSPMALPSLVGDTREEQVAVMTCHREPIQRLPVLSSSRDSNPQDSKPSLYQPVVVLYL